MICVKRVGRKDLKDCRARECVYKLWLNQSLYAMAQVLQADNFVYLNLAAETVVIADAVRHGLPKLPMGGLLAFDALSIFSSMPTELVATLAW